MRLNNNGNSNNNGNGIPRHAGGLTTATATAIP